MDGSNLLPTEDPNVRMIKDAAGVSYFALDECRGCGEPTWLLYREERRFHYCSRECAFRHYQLTPKQAASMARRGLAIELPTEGTARESEDAPKAAPKASRGTQKVSDEQIVEIRVAAAQGTSQKQLAEDYGLSYQTVNSIVAKRMRAEAGGPDRVERGKLTDQQVKEIKDSFAAGVSQAELARKYEVRAGYIHTIVRGHRR